MLLIAAIGLLAGHCGADEAAALPDIVFSLKVWEGTYVSQDVPGGVKSTPAVSTIWGVRADGSELRKLVDIGGAADAPTLSPDGRWLYFQCNTGGHYSEYRCRPDGSGVENLTANHGLGAQWLDAYGSSLSADGSKMTYTVHDGSIGNVVVANADGTEARLLAPELGYTYMAVMSPDGRGVVFSGPARGYRLLLCDLPDGPARELTPEHPDSYAPQFTPDGKAVVFVRRDGDVYRVNADGGNLQRLTVGNEYVEFRLSAQDSHGSTDGPRISPDGKMIAYISRREGTPNLWVMDLDGSNQRQLTRRTTPCGRPRWSPDGRQLAFVSFEGDYPQLFVVGLDGGEPRRLTDLQGAVSLLEWRR